MLHLLHRCSNFCLFQSIFGKCLVSIFQLSDLFLLQIDSCHFPVVVRQLLVIVVVRWLLVLLKLVDRLLALLLAFICTCSLRVVRILAQTLALSRTLVLSLLNGDHGLIVGRLHVLSLNQSCSAVHVLDLLLLRLRCHRQSLCNWHLRWLYVVELAQKLHLFRAEV